MDACPLWSESQPWRRVKLPLTATGWAWDGLLGDVINDLIYQIRALDSFSKRTHQVVSFQQNLSILQGFYVMLTSV